MTARPRTVVLLGAQRTDPTLGAVVASLGITGKIAVVSAGWQEREAEDEDLAAHLAGRTVNLRLHARADEVFRADPEFSQAHRERQQRLSQRQDFYRVRLEHALEADYVVRQRRAPADLLEEETEASIASIRALDEWHLARCLELHREFEATWHASERPAIARQRRELADIVSDCSAIAVAGGHVATLLNRLSLFGIAELAADRAIFAWSAGAMAISERIVLFHDDPPQGPGASEVLDAGLGLARAVVALPAPEQRLRLDRKERVSLMARRFAPAACVGLPARAYVVWEDGRAVDANGAFVLDADGEHAPLVPSVNARSSAQREEIAS